VKSPTWSLASELELARDLFALHLLRDSNLFTLVWEVPSPLPEVAVPPMILLPLAENAVKHGPSAGHRGALRVLVTASADAVIVAVENAGPYRGPRPGSEGLPTIERRLKLAYGDAASLRIGGVGDRTRAEMTLPRAGPRRGINV